MENKQKLQPLHQINKKFYLLKLFKKKIIFKGSAKLNKKNKKFIITKFCDNSLEHIPLEYEKFVELVITETDLFLNLNKNIYVMILK